MDEDSRERQKCKLKMKFMSSWSLLSWIMMLQSLSTKSSSVVELLNLWRWCSVFEALQRSATQSRKRVSENMLQHAVEIVLEYFMKSSVQENLNMINAYFELRNIAKCGVCCMSLSSFNIREISHFSNFYDPALKRLFVATLEELWRSLKAFCLPQNEKRDFVVDLEVSTVLFSFPVNCFE